MKGLSNTISLRLTKDEYDFVRDKIDYFFFDSASSYIRSLIRNDMQSERSLDSNGFTKIVRS